MGDRDSIMCGELTPGFFELNLRILSGVDTQQLSYMLGEQKVELRNCPDCMKPVIRNIIAILTYAQPLLRHEAITMMEEIHNQYPDNLNTLANMIGMLQKKKQNTSELEAELDEALKNHKEQAKCWVEKGYVLIMDLHSEARESASTKVKDTMSRLIERREAGEFPARGAQKTCRDAHTLLQKVDKLLLSIPESCTEETKQERIQSIFYFERGIQEMEKYSCSSEEITIWQHHLGKSCNRVGSSSPGLKVREKKLYLKQAIDAFVKSICGIPLTTPENEIFIARSYAYLSHLIITKDRIVKGEQEEVPRSLQALKIPIWKQPLQGFEEAIQICPDDRVVLNRYGLALNKIQGDETKEVNAFQKAVDMLKKSIEIEGTYNWFAFSVLGQTYMHQYKLQFKAYSKEKKRPPPNKGLLDTALQYGGRCLERRTTLDCLLNMAEAHYLKGINPEKAKSVKDRVKDPASINKALGFLQRGLEHHQCYSHPRLYSMLGKCLFDSGDREQGIQQMQLAIRVEKDNIKDPNNFGEMMTFLLQYYQESKVKTKGRYCWRIEAKRRLQREIWCIFKESKRKYKNRIKYHLTGTINKYPHDIMDILEQMFTCKTDQETYDLALEFKLILSRHHAERVQSRATDVFRRLKTPESSQGLPEDTSLVISGPEKPLLSDDKKYDFYVCHTHRDADWVNMYLLKDLERPLQGGNGFKGCLRGRDVRQDASPSHVMDQCHKFLFIINKGWEDDERFQADLSYAKATNPMTNRLIPILRDDIDLPKTLQDVNCVDCDEVLKIRQAVASDVENTSIEGREVDDDEAKLDKGMETIATDKDMDTTVTANQDMDTATTTTDQDKAKRRKKDDSEEKMEVEILYPKRDDQEKAGIVDNQMPDKQTNPDDSLDSGFSSFQANDASLK